MLITRVPKNIKIHNFKFESYDKIPDDVFTSIRQKYEHIKCDNPLVSINIIAWNEEKQILKTISSLVSIKSKYPFEIVITDNNSKDRTSDIIKRCGIEPVFETRQGYGPARQAALFASRGKVVITGDADAIYPETWVDAMAGPILNGKAIATCGQYSFIPSEGKSRINLGFYEMLRDAFNRMRSLKRPELLAYGVNFGFVKEAALKVGFAKDSNRSEDGRLAFGLKKQGTLKIMRGLKSRAWTDSRSIEKDRSLFASFFSRFNKELKRLRIYFYQKKPS